MERYSVQQRVNIIKLYFENNKSLVATIRKVRAVFGGNNVPNPSTVKRIVEKFETTGSVIDVKHSTRYRRGRSVQNVSRVRDSVAVNPKTSIRRRSQELAIPRSTMQRILTKDLHMHAYKIHLTQQLLPTDHRQRREFVRWVMEQQEVDIDFPDKIIFSDEAHFHLDGFVNKQNCRIWGTENPRVIQEKHIHPKRVTVWCALWSGGIIGPFFFENDEGNALTVTGVRYRDMINNFFVPELEDLSLENMWFQQDGATCHTARETLALLREHFPGRVISRFGDENFPPRSCDLTPLDYFLWGYLKSLVYVNKPTTIEALKAEIVRCINEIQPEVLKFVIENFVQRVRACNASRGGHLPDILFHT